MKIVDGCILLLIDVADMYAEKIVTKNDKLFYEYNSDYYLLKLITVKYQKRKINSKIFKTYFTNHGPIMAEQDGNGLV
jgi:acyl-homoserine lactone acylase PvdQ